MAYFLFENVAISGICTAIPKTKILTNKTPEVDKKIQDTGVEARNVSIEEQTSADLGYMAAKDILNRKGINPEQIGILLFLTKTPDYRTPPSAPVLQYRLGIPKDILAYDINVGNTGFIYGLQVGASLLESMPVTFALIIVGDTSSKLFSDANPNKQLFGDGASAILLEKRPGSNKIAISTEVQTESFHSFFLREGGFRIKNTDTVAENIDLFIDENQYFSFILKEIPGVFNKFLEKTNTVAADYDLVAFHQEQKAILTKLSDLLNIPGDKMPLIIDSYGNTSGASIPLIISQAAKSASNEINVLACAFGEGFSSGVASFSIDPNNIFPVIETDEFFTEGSVTHEL